MKVIQCGSNLFAFEPDGESGRITDLTIDALKRRGWSSQLLDTVFSGPLPPAVTDVEAAPESDDETRSQGFAGSAM